jgi:hypothetical protein
MRLVDPQCVRSVEGGRQVGLGRQWLFITTKGREGRGGEGSREETYLAWCFERYRMLMRGINPFPISPARRPYILAVRPAAKFRAAPCAFLNGEKTHAICREAERT